MSFSSALRHSLLRAHVRSAAAAPRAVARVLPRSSTHSTVTMRHMSALSAAPPRLPARAAPAFASAAQSVSRHSRHLSTSTTSRASGHSSDSGDYGGFEAPHVAEWHKNTAWALGTIFWFWIFYRFYHDGTTLLFGFDPGHGHDDDHGHAPAPKMARLPGVTD